MGEWRAEPGVKTHSEKSTEIAHQHIKKSALLIEHRPGELVA
jgi:hypothetical protein